MSARPGILGAVAALALAACGSDTDRGGPGATTTTTTVTTTSGTGTSTVPASDCPDALAPLADQGQVETVGDGTAASCTEAALRAAVTTLNGVAGGGTIHFDCGGEATLTLASSLLVTAPLVVDGGGVVTLSGGGTTRVFELDHYVDFAVQRLTIANGVAPDSGGAILHPWYGTLRAVDVRFVNNHALSLESDIGGGAVFAGGLTAAVFSGCVFEGNSASNGGGLLNRGSDLTVIDTAFVDNAALSIGDGQFGNGGGLYIDGMNYDVPGDFRMCGAVFTQNRAQTHGSAVFSYFYPGSHSFIDRTLFEGNHFDGSPSGGAGGLYHEAVPLLLTASTFVDNRSDAHAAALFIGSGSTVDVVNTTFTGNHTPGNGAGIFDGSSPLTITNSTFSANDADYGPAIFKGGPATITVANTLFAHNTTANQWSALACHEALGDGGGNLQWPENKPASGNPDQPCTAGITFADPGLLPLADNGGPTPTLALPAGSPAIDVGSACPATDQRGLPRSVPCDAGAFELQP